MQKASGELGGRPYTLKVWHPSIGVQEAKITVSADGAVEANFVFSASE
jgi:hypothetical protein